MKQEGPQGFLRTDAGENANKGLDGVYPLVAGACTARHKARRWRI